MLTIYIALCIIWSVFFTGYIMRDFKNESIFWIATAFIVFFVIHSIFTPISIYQNFPMIIDDFKER